MRLVQRSQNERVPRCLGDQTEVPFLGTEKGNGAKGKPFREANEKLSFGRNCEHSESPDETVQCTYGQFGTTRFVVCVHNTTQTWVVCQLNITFLKKIRMLSYIVEYDTERQDCTIIYVVYSIYMAKTDAIVWQKPCTKLKSRKQSKDMKNHNYGVL